VLRGAELTGAQTVTLPLGASERQRGRVVPKAVVDAHEEAQRVVAEAHSRAREILAQARAEAAELELRLQEEARVDAAASVAARALALELRESRIDAERLDRTAEVARLLAERLLGEALRLEPILVAALARQALAEARGARAVRLICHPEDATLLASQLAELGFTAGAVRVEADAARSRGNLRLETDIGSLDAAIAPQLDRLMKQLREALQSGL
jgi:flagellar biosynthesis/type III secretory pathway protein FliH